MTIRFINAQLLRHHRIERGDLWIAHGKVLAPQPYADQTVDVQGKLIAPGFIDLQVNGAFGCDLSSAPEKVGDIAKQLGQFGVTSFLATVISSSPDHYRNILPILQQHIGNNGGGSHLLGIHLEGPCFHPSQAKAHRQELLRPCTDFKTPEDCYGNMKGVKLVTLAPELPGALDWIGWLAENRIVVSAGHSMASAEQMREVMDTGVTMATHLFNAMGPLHHRLPGLVGSVLNRRGFYYSIIADGVHVDPLVVDLAWRCQPEGFFLVSDGMAALGLAKGGCFSLAGRNVEVDESGARLLGTNVLAGGVMGMDQLVRNMRKFTGATLIEVLEAASLKPATVLGLYPSKGSLEVGADADLVILDEFLQVAACYVGGLRLGG